MHKTLQGNRCCTVGTVPVKKKMLDKRKAKDRMEVESTRKWLTVTEGGGATSY